jgi:hypothetical protein
MTAFFSLSLSAAYEGCTFVFYHYSLTKKCRRGFFAFYLHFLQLSSVVCGLMGVGYDMSSIFVVASCLLLVVGFRLPSPAC